MQRINHTISLLATATVCLLLGACISSPLPGGTVGALYQWVDLETPVVTTQGVRNPIKFGFFDGDFNLSNLSIENPELSSTDDYPWLFEACNKEQCYSMVLFSNDFKREFAGKLSGEVSMSVLSTLMANEVKGLPADKVRSALDTLSAELSHDGVTDYAAFIALYPRRLPMSREKLLYPALYDEAVALHHSQPAATVQTLLGKEVEKTASLEVSSDFAFDSSWQLIVDVDLYSWRNTPAYLLLCSDFEASGGVYTVDYSSCPLKTPLPSGDWMGEVKLTRKVEELIVVIMPLQNPNDPDYTLWQRAIDGEMLILR